MAFDFDHFIFPKILIDILEQEFVVHQYQVMTSVNWKTVSVKPNWGQILHPYTEEYWSQILHPYEGGC